MELYKGLYVVTKQNGLQKVTPADKLKTVDESKLYKVMKEDGKAGAVKLLSATRDDIEEVKRQNRKLSGRYSHIAPKPVQRQVANVAIKNSDGVTMTTIAMATPTTNRRGVMAVPSGKNKSFHVNASNPRTRQKTEDGKGPKVGVKKKPISPFGAEIRPPNLDTVSVVSPAPIMSQMSKNSQVVTGRLSHLAPSSVPAPNSASIPRPLFVIKPTANKGLTKQTTTYGAAPLNFHQFPVSSANVNQKTTIRVIPNQSTAQATFQPVAVQGQNISTASKVMLPGLTTPQYRFTSPMSSTSGIRLVGSTGNLVPGNPIRVVFSSSTQSSVVPSSIPLVYSSNMSTSTTGTRKVLLRTVPQSNSLNASQLGLSMTSAAASGINVIPSVTATDYKVKQEKDTTMDLKIGSVFSLADASALWDDDSNGATKTSKDVRDIGVRNPGFCSALQEPVDAAVSLETDLRPEAAVDGDKLVGDQMQVSIASLAVQHLGDACEMIDSVTEDDENVIHIVSAEATDDKENLPCETGDENFFHELGDECLISQHHRKARRPTKACNVESAFFPVLNELIEKRKNRKVQCRTVRPKHKFETTASPTEASEQSSDLPTEKSSNVESQIECMESTTNDKKLDMGAPSTKSLMEDSMPDKGSTEDQQLEEDVCANESDKDDVVTIEPELHETAEDGEYVDDVISSYPELGEEGTVVTPSTVSEPKEGWNKKRKQFCPEKYVQGSALLKKKSDSTSPMLAGPVAEPEVPKQLEKMCYRIQDPNRTSLPRVYRLQPERIPSPPNEESATDSEKSPTPVTKQIRIVTVPMDKTSGPTSVSLNPTTGSTLNFATQRTASKPSTTTQGFLRIVKGGKVQMVPIRISRGANGMILTPVNGEIGAQSNDEMGLKPIATLEKYRGMPKFGPSIEQMCFNVCKKKDIIEALETTELVEEDIADFKKVFSSAEEKVERSDFINLVKERPVFQTPHNDMFAIRPWTKAEERRARRRYRCKKCRVKLDKLTLTGNQTINLRNVLQAQLYCGYEYFSDDEISDEDFPSDLFLSCEEVCLYTDSRNISETVVVDQNKDGSKDFIRGIELDLTEMNPVRTCVGTVRSFGNKPESVQEQVHKTSGYINETVDPIEDHNYSIIDNDVDNTVLDENMDEDEGEDVTDETEETRATPNDKETFCHHDNTEPEEFELDDDQSESQLVQYCLNDFLDDVPDVANGTDKDELPENNNDGITSSLTGKEKLPEKNNLENNNENAEKIVDNVPDVSQSDDADICRSVLLDLMDFEQNTSVQTESVNNRSPSPIPEDTEAEGLDVVSLGTDSGGYDDDSSAQVDDTVVIDVEPAQLVETDNVDAQLGQNEVGAGEIIDLNTGNQPVYENLEIEREIAPIVIAPISDTESDAEDIPQDLDVQITAANVRDQFHFIGDNVVGEVNVKVERANSPPEVPLNNCQLPNGYRHPNQHEQDFEGYGGESKSTKEPKKKKRRSSSDAVEPKEKFSLRFPAEYWHIPFVHSYSLLHKDVAYPKRVKHRKKHKDESGTRPTKVRRIQPGASHVPTAKDVKTTSVLDQRKKSEMVKVRATYKPTFFFRVSADNKLINFGDLKKVGQTSLKPKLPLSSTPGGTSLLKTKAVSSTASATSTVISSATSTVISSATSTVISSATSTVTSSVPSMASISAKSASQLSSLLKSPRSGAASFSKSSASSESLTTAAKSRAAAESQKSSTSHSKSQVSLLKSPPKKSEVQKDKESKLLSLLKPLQPGTKIKLKNVSVAGGSNPTPKADSKSPFGGQKTTKRFQVKFVNGQAKIIPKDDAGSEAKTLDLKQKVGDAGDSKKVEGQKEGEKATKRKLESKDDGESDAKNMKFEPKEDRIQKLKEQLRSQEEELEKIKRSREATKTLLSLYESDT